MCTLFCVCPPRVESLFLSIPLKSCNQIPLAFKVWFSRNSFSRCWTPKFGNLMWGSEPSLQWVDFCGISVLQFVSHPPSSYGIWFYCDCAPPTVSLWLLLCLWMWGIFFGEFQCLPVDDCAAVSCDSGVLTRGSESTFFYSTILNQSPMCKLFWFFSFYSNKWFQHIYPASVKQPCGHHFYSNIRNKHWEWENWMKMLVFLISGLWSYISSLSPLILHIIGILINEVGIFMSRILDQGWVIWLLGVDIWCVGQLTQW